MQGIKIFKKFMMPGGLCAAVPVAKPNPISPEKPVECSNDMTEKKLIRPSELPIYVHDQPSSRETVPWTNQNSVSSYIEEGFGTVRKSVQGVVSEYVHITDTVKDKLNTSIEHSSLMLDYLREESNMLPRVGAVAIGGLTGLIFSLRGGKFKKLVYTTSSALTVAAVCYPKEARESLTASKHYINIGYNFIYGVKPGEEPLEISWPELPKLKFPSSFSEFFDLAIVTGTSIVDAVQSTISQQTTTADEKQKEVPSKVKEN